jgi:DNA replication factor GINS
VYNELYEAWRKEMENEEIQMLPKDFYVRLADYVRKMREESRMLDKKTTRAKLMEREFKNVKTLIKKLLQLRYKKSLDNAKTGKPLPKDHLTEEEERLYAEIPPLAESYQALFKEISRGRLPGKKSKKKAKGMVVRFLKEVPEIVGADMKTYGPFKAEDVATLPVENAKALIKQEVAVEVETKA